MGSKVMELESMEIIVCGECGSDHLKGIWNGDEEYIDLQCRNCGKVITSDQDKSGNFKLKTAKENK